MESIKMINTSVLAAFRAYSVQNPQQTFDYKCFSHWKIKTEAVLTRIPNFELVSKKRFLFYSQLYKITNKFEIGDRSEEHTSELQSRSDLVCRLLLEKKKKKKI